MTLRQLYASLRLITAAVLVVGIFVRYAGAIEPVSISRCRVKLIDSVLLASELNGVVDYVTPREGDVVQAGMPVAGLRAEAAIAALTAAERQAEDNTEIRYADAAGALADHEYETGQDLFRRNAMSDLEVRRLRLEADRGRVQAEKARFDQEIHRLTRDIKAAELKGFTIHAPPFDGVVTRVLRSPGEAVRQGEPLLEVVSTRRLRVEGYVPVSAASSLGRGNDVSVQAEGDDLPPDLAGRDFADTLIFIDPSVEPNTRTVRIWAEVANPDGLLRAGLTARMTVVPGTGRADGAVEPETPDSQ